MPFSMHPVTGNTGAIVGSVRRVDNGGCVKALVLDGNANYVVIPYTSANHPADGVTVSLWFYVNDTFPQTLVSTRVNGNGGYRLAFDDGKRPCTGRLAWILRAMYPLSCPTRILRPGSGTT